MPRTNSIFVLIYASPPSQHYTQKMSPVFVHTFMKDVTNKHFLEMGCIRKLQITKVPQSASHGWGRRTLATARARYIWYIWWRERATCKKLEVLSGLLGDRGQSCLDGVTEILTVITTLLNPPLHYCHKVHSMWVAWHHERRIEQFVGETSG